MNNYCPYCGSVNNNGGNFCQNCGAHLQVQPVNNYYPNVQNNMYQQKTNGIALAGFITAMVSLILNFWGIVGIVATVLSGVGISKTGPGKEKGRGLAIAGLIVGIFSIVWGLFSIAYLSYIFN